MKHRDPARKRLRLWRMVFLCLVAGVLAVSALAFLSRDKAASSNHPEHANPSDPYATLLGKLAELDSALNTRLDGAALEHFATDIQAEIKRNPLPPGDDFYFQGELIVRYLRTLAPLENLRDVRMGSSGYDPLDPSGPHPNQEAIASHKKVLASLRARARDLRSMLEKRKGKSR